MAKHKYDELVGKKCNTLRILEKDKELSKKRGETCFKCECERCGKICYKKARSLADKTARCLYCDRYKKGLDNPCTKDLTGRKYGRLTVMWMFHDGKRNYCHCKCECGQEKDIRADNLVNGRVKSCGCELRKTGLDNHCSVDLTGRVFGDLLVLGLDEEASAKDKNGNVWKCLCQKCGNIVSVSATHLTGGNTRSCGCETESHGEQLIEEIFSEWGFVKNVDYKRQIRFEDLIGTGGGKLSYDFEILKGRPFLIEYQGIQHFRAVERFGGKEQFERQKEHDRLKAEYARERNIPLCRISYKNRTREQTEKTLKAFMTKNGIIPETKRIKS